MNCSKCKWFESYYVKGEYVTCCGRFEKRVDKQLECEEFSLE